jgi:NADPH:quinone reductase-like Zn-dependent oxidoreductase
MRIPSAEPIWSVAHLWRSLIMRNALPFEVVPAMIEKNITLRGFNLEGSLPQVPQALSALFKLVGEGKLKFEITKYPLREAAKVHQLFEARKTSGKLVLVPQN